MSTYAVRATVRPTAQTTDHRKRSSRHRRNADRLGLDRARAGIPLP